LLLNDEQLRRGVLPELRVDDYEDLSTAPIFRALLELDKDNIEIKFDSVNEKIEGDETSASLLPMLFMSESLHASNEHYAADECIQTFRLMKLQHRIDELRTEVGAAEREGDSEKASRLSAEQIELTKRRSALMPKGEPLQQGNA
jgi:hypothetical protein